MRLRTTTLVATLLGLCLLASAPLHAALVTIDSATKKGTSDDANLEVKGVQIKGEQVGFLVQNTSLGPQRLKAVVSGLKDQDYDIYINSSFAGTKTFAQMEAGLDLDIPGTIADPSMMRCLQALTCKVGFEYTRIKKIDSPEPQRVAYTLQQASTWVASGQRCEKSYRSVTVMVAPAGKMLYPMQWTTRFDAEGTARSVTRACWLLQQARARMYTNIKQPDLRNQAVVAMTPVDLTAVSSSKNGKLRVEATLANNCDLPISGKIMVSLPKGWKATAKNPKFIDLKSGKVAKVTFDVTPTVKNAAAPEKIVVAASATVAQESMVAEFKLVEIAKSAASAAAE